MSNQHKPENPGKKSKHPGPKKWGHPVFLTDKRGKNFRNPLLVAAEKGYELKRGPQYLNTNGGNK